MIEFFQRNHRLIILIPLSSIVVFSAIFDLLMRGFFLDELFPPSRDIHISAVKGAFLLVALACAIIVCAALATCAVATHNFRIIESRPRERKFFLVAGLVLSIAFILYNFAGYWSSQTNFVRLTYGLFAQYAMDDVKSVWTLSPRAFFSIYAISITLIVVAAMFLASSSVALSLKCFDTMDEERSIRHIRDKLQAFRVSFYLSAVLISSAILVIFSWHHLLRVSMTDPGDIIDFSQFMFSFSIYWGVGYSLIIILVFGPVGIVFNRQLDDFVNFSLSRKEGSHPEYMRDNAIVPLRLTEGTTIVAAFSPLLTGLASNTVSLGLWGLT